MNTDYILPLQIFILALTTGMLILSIIMYRRTIKKEREAKREIKYIQLCIEFKKLICSPGEDIDIPTQDVKELEKIVSKMKKYISWTS